MQPGLGGYAKVAANFNIVTQLHLAPLGHGGPNGVYALVSSRQMKRYGLQKSDYGHLAIAQRAWAAHNPYAVYRAPMTMEDYRAVGRRPFVALRLRAGGRGCAGHRRRPPRSLSARPRGRARACAPRKLQLRQPGGGRVADRHRHLRWRAVARRRRTSCGYRCRLDLRRLSDHGARATQRSRHDPGQRSCALRAPRHRRATVSPQYLGWDALRRPAGRPRWRTEWNLGSGAAIAAPRRRAPSRGRKARGDDRIWHDDVSLWGHRRRCRVGAGGMNRGVAIWRCVKCRTGFFPQRLLCSRCHGDTFEEDRVYQAVVEEISTIRHMLGQTDWQPRRIASVRTSDGQRITVGLTDESEPGTVIELFEENAAPFGAAKK